MIPSLRDLQAGFARAIRSGDDGPAVWVVDAGLPGRERLGIHANHHHLSLVAALGETFAPVRRLVGDDFFDSLARRYVAARPPTSPCLFEYGADFGGFAATDPVIEAAEFLPDLLTFAFAVNRAATAADAARLTQRDLAALGADALPPLRLGLHPSVSLPASRYPLTALWRLAVDETGDAPVVDLAAGAERLVVWRDNEGPAWRRLDAGEHRFLKQLGDGETLADAAEAAQGADPMFHLAEALALGLRDGWFAAQSSPEVPR